MITSTEKYAIITAMENNRKYLNYIPYLVLLLCGAVLFHHSRLSFCASDEAFYASTTNRFLLGDAIFVHEWFPTQLVSLILLPVQWAYVSIHGANDGILLFMRHIYVIFSLISGSLVYKLISKKYNMACALFCGLYVMIYAHLNIATMSYYTLSFHFFLLAMLLLLNQTKSSYIFGGICFALSVLALPTLALCYFAFAFIYALAFILNKLTKGKIEILSKYTVLLFQPVIYSFLGIIIPAIIVLIYVLPRSGISGIINNLQYVLSDEEHITSLVAPFKKFFTAITDVFGSAVYLTVLITLIAISIYIFRDILKKKYNRLDNVIFSLFIINMILCFYHITNAFGHTGFLSTVIMFMGIPVFFISEKKNWGMLFLIYLGGLAFSMVYSYSSNGDLYVLSIGHSISAIAAICFLFDFNEGKLKTSYLTIFLPVLCAVLLLITFSYRMLFIYRDAPVIELTEEITDGPAQGLYTTSEHKKQYDDILATIKEYENQGHNVFFTKLLPWGYLATSQRCAAPTTWRTKFSSDRLRLYYDNNPDRVPDVIFVLPNDAGAYDSCGDVVADPIPNENEIGGYLESITNGYTTAEENGITVYYKP